MKERSILTGRSGFIGSRLWQTLGEPKVALPHSQFTNEEYLRVVLAGADRIYHLAGYGNHHTQKDVKGMYKANVLALINLLQALNSTDYQAFINVGSSSEYGKKKEPMKESDVLEPTTMYAATKAAGTMLARAWSEIHDKPIVTVRPFSVYGPGERDDRFIPTLIRCALTGEEATVAPGVHDWIFVDDFLDGMRLVAEHARELKGCAVNIGTGVQSTNHQVVSAVERVTGRKIKIKYVPQLRDYDTTVSWVADNTLLKSLGWKPQHTLEEGVEKVYEKVT